MDGSPKNVEKRRVLVAARVKKERNIAEWRAEQALKDDLKAGITPTDRIRINNEMAVTIRTARTKKENESKERLNYLIKNNIAHCPKCMSPSVTPVKKGFGIGKAAVGAVLLGLVGLVGGVIGANKIEFVCNNCGCRYKK